METGLDSFICKNFVTKMQNISELKLQIEHLKSELQSYVAPLAGYRPLSACIVSLPVKELEVVRRERQPISEFH